MEQIAPMTTTPNLAALLAPVLALVEEASAAIMAVYATGHDVEYKADDSPITRADRAAQLPRGLVLHRFLLGQLLGRALLQHRLVVEGQLRRLAGAAAQGVDGAVADDAEHPGADASAGAVEARVGPPDREEGLLRDVLSGDAIAHDPGRPRRPARRGKDR